ncbi:MAG: M20 family metallopeptidase [Desulfobacterales bacterium]|nr:M20 family metallopeptidase [Desulfobacterales bacterium]
MKEFIESRYDTFVSDLETLVNLDSSSGNSQGIARVAGFLKERLTAIGMTCDLQFLGEDKVPCLKAESKPARSGPDRAPYDLMCMGHMDTVFPEGEAAKRPFSKDDTRAYGPGVCDMKGGLLVALHGVEALHHAGLLDKLSICICFNGDEETGSKASRPWIEENARNSRRVLVFEPCRPGFNVVLRRKGGGWFHIRTKGKSAHAGADPDKGINAVVELAHQITRIQAFNDAEADITAQVTVAHGGDKVNIIPATAMAAVDVRTTTQDAGDRVSSFFEDLARTPHFPGSEILVNGNIDRPPMEFTPEAEVLYGQIRDCAASLGFEINGISTGGCSDGNFTAAQGTPTIDGMGTVGGNSHREDEYIELSSFVPMVSLMAELCREFSTT